MVVAHALMALAPVLGLTAYCLSHLVACRIVGQVSNLPRKRRIGNPPHGPYFPLVIGCGCGLAATAAISLAALPWMHGTLADGLALAAVNVVAYLALGLRILQLRQPEYRLAANPHDPGAGRVEWPLAGRAPNRPLQHRDGHRSADRPPDPRRAPGRAATGGTIPASGGSSSSRGSLISSAGRFWAVTRSPLLPGEGQGGEGGSSSFASYESPSLNHPHPSPLPEGEGTALTVEPVTQLAP